MVWYGGAMHLIGVPGDEATSSDQSPRLLDLAMSNNVVCVEEDHEEGDARRCQLQQLINVVTIHEYS